MKLYNPELVHLKSAPVYSNGEHSRSVVCNLLEANLWGGQLWNVATRETQFSSEPRLSERSLAEHALVTRLDIQAVKCF